MYKDVLRSIDDVSLFPVIAILIFFVFFAILLVYVIKMDKQSVKQMAGIPLSEAEKLAHTSSTSPSNNSKTN